MIPTDLPLVRTMVPCGEHRSIEAYIISIYYSVLFESTTQCFSSSTPKLNSRIYKIHHIYARKNRQVFTDLQTSCYHLVIMLTMVTDLLQVVPTRLIQAVSNH
jgi:hypothetical protein